MATRRRKRADDEIEEETQERTIDTGPDPWTQVKKAEDLDDLFVMKALLYGPNGSGKSQAGAMFKRPLIGPTELQGIPTIRKANPGAVIYHDPDGEPGIRTVNDLRRFVMMARSAKDHGCDAVVLDGLTDTQRILKEHFTKRQKNNKGRTSMDSWGAIIDMTSAIVRQLRDLAGVHVLVTCLEREVEANEELVHRPGLSGKALPHEIGQYFNVVGYSHKAELDAGIRHQVLFEAGERYVVKGLAGIDAIEPPEPLHWISKAIGGDVPDEVAERVRRWEEMGSASAVDDDENDDRDDDDHDADVDDIEE